MLPGIHQDGMLKNKLTYEIIDASTIGIDDNDGIVLGKHSGRAAVRSKLEKMGMVLTDDELNKTFVRLLVCCYCVAIVLLMCF